MKRVTADAYILAKEGLTYDETSPSCLRWIKDGKPAGCQDGKGYWLVRVGSRPGKLLRAHRIIWFIFHGTLPHLLDHEDTDPANNRIGNLRVATEGQNRANSKGHRDSQSGIKGVSWDSRTQSWYVRVHHNYTKHWGGYFKDKNLAIEAAKELREKLHKGFARHG